MKKMVKKVTAALLSMTCMSEAGLLVHAMPDGMTTWKTFKGKNYVNDHGMLSGENGLLFINETEKNNYVTVVKPRENVMRFILRDDVDIDTSAKQMVTLLEAYYPGILQNYDTEAHSAFLFPTPDKHFHEDGTVCAVMFSQDPTWISQRAFELKITSEQQLKEAVTQQTSILVDFARNHLITEFYGLGETASYSDGYIGEVVNGDLDILSGYEYFSSIVQKDETGTKDVWTIGPAKWNVDDVQNYLTEHHPGCMIELYKTDYNVDGNEDGTVTKTPLNYYHVISSEELSYRQEIELGGELYEQFGMRPRGGFMESNNLNATGHNALEQPGDTNLDCEVDILDVIAANKHILGVGTLDKTGLKNADMDGSGIVDSADSLEILKTILS